MVVMFLKFERGQDRVFIFCMVGILKFFVNDVVVRLNEFIFGIIFGNMRFELLKVI